MNPLQLDRQRKKRPRFYTPIPIYVLLLPVCPLICPALL
jgi:hypothetical protein